MAKSLAPTREGQNAKLQVVPDSGWKAVKLNMTEAKMTWVV